MKYVQATQTTMAHTIDELLRCLYSQSAVKESNREEIHPKLRTNSPGAQYSIPIYWHYECTRWMRLLGLLTGTLVALEQLAIADSSMPSSPFSRHRPRITEEIPDFRGGSQNKGSAISL